MEKIWLPDNIKRMIDGKSCTLDHIGMSDSQIYIFDNMVLKIQRHSEETDNEYRVCRWLKNRLPVPDILEYQVVNGRAYCLMSRISGEMLCDDVYMSDPARLLDLIVQAMEMLWTVDITGCPCDNTLDVKLEQVRYNVENNLVDTDNTEPETFGENGFASPEKLLQWLYDNRPKEELVFSHGDFCLPNILAEGDRITGFIDLGKTGIADRWQDIAICYRSLMHNFEGKYSRGVSYKGYHPDMLFQKLGIGIDQKKLRYYILLDELF